MLVFKFYAKDIFVGFVISIFGILNAAEMSIDISEKIDISSDNIEIKEGKIELKIMLFFNQSLLKYMERLQNIIEI